MNKKLILTKAGQKFAFTLKAGDKIRRSNKFGSFAFDVLEVENRGNFIELYVECIESTNRTAFKPPMSYILSFIKPKTIIDILK